eukprot:698551_1
MATSQVITHQSLMAQEGYESMDDLYCRMISHEKNEKNKDKNGEEHNITIDDDIDCGDAYNDTFIINYTLVYTATIPPNMPSTVQPSYCLHDSYILAHHTTDLDILSRQRMFPILSIISITINGSSFTTPYIADNPVLYLHHVS